MNNSKKVSEATRKKVEEALAQNNYSPNAMARGLVSNSMKTIGVLAVDIRHYTHAAISYTVERELCKWDYSTILCNTSNNLDNKIKYIKMLSEKKVDGIILIGSVFNDKEIERSIFNYLKEVPIVLANGKLSLENSYSVLGDQIHAINLGVEHLLERGHKDICFIQEDLTYSALQKSKGFSQSMSNHGLACDKSNILQTTLGLKGGYDVVDQLLNTGKKFSALIFSEDGTAIGGMMRLQEQGIKIPEDIAIVGYDNSIYSQLCTPKLTTIDTKSTVIATLVANTMYDILNKKQVTNSLIVQASLVVREST
jgi:LacI family transcriptional regulator